MKTGKSFKELSWTKIIKSTFLSNTPNTYFIENASLTSRDPPNVPVSQNWEYQSTPKVTKTDDESAKDSRMTFHFVASSQVRHQLS